MGDVLSCDTAVAVGSAMVDAWRGLNAEAGPPSSEVAHGAVHAPA
jgi:hypothetical protein